MQGKKLRLDEGKGGRRKGKERKSNKKRRNSSKREKTYKKRVRFKLPKNFNQNPEIWATSQIVCGRLRKMFGITH